MQIKKKENVWIPSVLPSKGVNEPGGTIDSVNSSNDRLDIYDDGQFLDFPIK